MNDAGDAGPAGGYRRAEAVMGTVFTFELRAGSGDDRTRRPAAEAVGRAVAWLRWVDATFSTFKADSEISRIDRGELAVGDAHREVQAILARCEELRGLTDGYFDARAGGRLDPSGLVKGWAAQRASDLLAAAGWGDHLVDGGGDVCLRGCAGPGQRWRVGLAHPFRADAYCAVLELDGGAVATSGTYERGFHVIDPHRGVPAAALAAVTVVGPELATADAYATAAVAMGTSALRWLNGLEDHEALVVDADGNGCATAGFDALRLALPEG